MSFWRRLFSRSRKQESGPFGEKGAEAWSPQDIMLTPAVFQQIILQGMVAPESLSRRCCHKEFAVTISECSNPAVVFCGHCGLGSCFEPFHIYIKFCTLRDSNLFGATGSRFFYRCENCCNFLCVNCLQIDDHYPCPAEQLESYRFECPTCKSPVTVNRIDNVDFTGVANLLVTCPSAMIRLPA